MEVRSLAFDRRLLSKVVLELRLLSKVVHHR